MRKYTLCLEDESSIEIDTTNKTSEYIQSFAEISNDKNDIEQYSDALDSVITDGDTLTQVQEILEEANSETANKIALIAVESIYKRLNIKVATESIKLESISEKLKSIWEAIIRAFKMMIEKITLFLKRVYAFATGSTLQNKVIEQELKQEIKKQERLKAEVSKVIQEPERYVGVNAVKVEFLNEADAEKHTVDFVIKKAKTVQADLIEKSERIEVPVTIAQYRAFFTAEDKAANVLTSQHILNGIHRQGHVVTQKVFEDTVCPLVKHFKRIESILHQTREVGFQSKFAEIKSDILSILKQDYSTETGEWDAKFDFNSYARLAYDVSDQSGFSLTNVHFKSLVPKKIESNMQTLKMEVPSLKALEDINHHLEAFNGFTVTILSKMQQEIKALREAGSLIAEHAKQLLADQDPEIKLIEVELASIFKGLQHLILSLMQETAHINATVTYQTMQIVSNSQLKRSVFH